MAEVRDCPPTPCTHLAKADPSVDYLQSIVIETKDGAMVGICYWRNEDVGDQSGAWARNRFTPLVQQSDERWKVSEMSRIAGDSGRRPSIIFPQESTAVGCGTCTQQNFNAKQAKNNASCL